MSITLDEAECTHTHLLLHLPTVMSDGDGGVPVGPRDHAKPHLPRPPRGLREVIVSAPTSTFAAS